MTLGSGGWGPEWSASLRRGSESELRLWLELAHAVCDEADGIALGAFAGEVAAEVKADRTLVTATDRSIESIVRERIVLRHPDHGLLGEEYGEATGSGSARWYIDPVDGTHNFVRGVPVFGTLLAVERDGELQMGMVSAPALGSRWWATRGGGAYAAHGGGPLTHRRVRRIRVSGIATLTEAHLVTSSPRTLEPSGLRPGWERLIEVAWRDRGFGDFWGYTLLAEGAADAMVEGPLASWDIAAPIVLVEEAGGRVTDLRGQRGLGRDQVIASNGLLHDELLRILAASTGP